MSAPHLLVEKDGHVATVTLNRPESRNALSTEMLVRLADAWKSIDQDPDVRVVILTGSGEHFCAGADLKAMSGDGFGDNEWTTRCMKDPDIHWRGLLRTARPNKPIVCAVQGYCLAGGMEILQATEIRVAGTGARFGLTEAKWSLFPLGGSTVRLQRQIPYTRAAEIMLGAQVYTADEAREMGLIGRVVPDDQVGAEARKWADAIASNGPLAIQAILRSMRETASMSEEDGLARELEIGWPILSTEDAKEGPKAFAEKRAPRFQGK